MLAETPVPDKTEVVLPYRYGSGAASYSLEIGIRYPPYDFDSRQEGGSHSIPAGYVLRTTLGIESVGLQRNDVQGLRLGGDAFFGCHVGQVGHDVFHAYSVEVIYLAPGEDGGQYFVFLRGGQNEDGMMGRLFQRLEEGIERRGGQHVHLVYDVHLVSAYLGRDAHLLYQLADVVDGVIGGGIQLVYVVRALLVEGFARFAFIARLAVGRGVQAVYGLGKDAGASGFPHPPGAAEQVGVGQLAGADGIFQRSGECALPYHGVEGGGAVFAGRYDIVFHIWQFVFANVRKKTETLGYSSYLCKRRHGYYPLHLILNVFIMNEMKSFWSFLCRHKRWANKYAVTCLLFVVIVGFLDENSLLRRLQNAREESRLQNEIERYAKEYEENTRRLQELSVDSGAIERIAREKYLMKKPNEDIFVFDEDLK